MPVTSSDASACFQMGSERTCFPFLIAATTSLYVTSRKSMARFCGFVSVTCARNGEESATSVSLETASLRRGSRVSDRGMQGETAPPGSAA